MRFLKRQYNDPAMSKIDRYLAQRELEQKNEKKEAQKKTINGVPKPLLPSTAVRPKKEVRKVKPKAFPRMVDESINSNTKW